MLTTHLTLSYEEITHSVPIPGPLHDIAEELISNFISSLSSTQNAAEDASTESTQPSSAAELCALFLYHVALNIGTNEELSGPNSSENELLECLIKHFEATFITTAGVHAMVASLPGTVYQHNAVIRAYYESVAVAGSAPHTVNSALFENTTRGKASVYAVFGGQGLTEDLLKELRNLKSTYASLVDDLFAKVSPLLSDLAQHISARTTYERFGFDVLEWLEQPLSSPAKEYITSAPVSMPLIGLLTLGRYCALCKFLGKTPGEMRKGFAGTTGHSQGVVVAAAIAAASSWEDFYRLAADAVTILFWIGVRCQQAQPQFMFTAAEIEDSSSNNEGHPGPMLSIRGLTEDVVQSHVSALNSHLDEVQRVYISITNSNENFVVSGPPRSLCNLNARLRKFNASPKINQARIPYVNRKTAFVHEFLPITAPFHSPYLEATYLQILNDLSNIWISTDDLAISTFSTHDGQDIRKNPDSNIVGALVRMIVQETVNWPQTTLFPGATHVLDFGPGSLSGAVALLKSAKQGTGTRLLLASEIAGIDDTIGYLPEILNTNEKFVHYDRPWTDEFGPKLTQTAAGEVYVDTKLSRLVGLPPIMVAGMTPTTVSPEFVAATMNSGYHIEMAGGGYLNAKEMTDAIEKVIEHAPRGRGVTCNFIYIAPAAMAWQIKMVRQLLAKGVNVEGITIGAGVPSMGVAQEYIEMGLKHIGFKPGSTEAIMQVIAIAQAHPEFPIILQWTGGRGGGHHSAEDFHQPLLASYHRIRQRKNIVLVIGSGFGGAKDSYLYLTGEWSKKYSYPAMPVDGILIGSRVMVAKEARTSVEAKRAIVAAPGVDEESWTNTYDGEAGGVISVQSEMGEAIHKISTRGTRFWAEMDKTIFGLDRSKRLAELNKRKPYIIQRLNADFQKPWFGKNNSGPTDLENMTYLEVVARAIELLYVKHEFRWVHESLKRPVEDFVRRIEQRFSNEKSSILSGNILDQPLELATRVGTAWPESATELMKHEDVKYFLSIFRRSGQKPAPFVPCLDDEFEYWFKKDSLWQSEDVQAVVDQDVQRVCILHGPVAAKYSQLVDEPVKSIMDGIHTTHIRWLLNEKYGNNMASVPLVEYFGCPATEKSPEDIQIQGFTAFRSQDRLTLSTNSLPSLEAFDQSSWYSHLAGQTQSWRSALFTSRFIMRDNVRIENPVRRLFAPRKNIKVEIVHPEEPLGTTIILLEQTASKLDSVVEVRSNADNTIHISLFAKSSAQPEGTSLTLIFNYNPEIGYCLITEDSSLQNAQIKRFYYRLWFGEEPRDLQLPLSHTFFDRNITVTKAAVEQYTSAIGGQHKKFGPSSELNPHVPLDLGILLAWKVLMKALFLDTIDGDILNLVHLSNEFCMIGDASPLQAGDVIDVSSRITEVVINDAGKVVTVSATIRRHNIPVIKIESSFQYRGMYEVYEGTFKEQEEIPLIIACKSTSDVAVLKSKPWFHYHGTDESLLNTRLKFDLRTRVTFKTKNIWSSISTSGDVLAESVNKSFIRVGTVKFEGGESKTNPVIDYLTRVGEKYNQKVDLERPIPLISGGTPLLFTTPPSNFTYAHVSRDYNPIHVSKSFSQLAGLPGTITHGMHTSAIVRNLIELNVPGCDIPSFKRFSCSFVGMVLPQSTLEVKVEHFSMISGSKLYSVVATNVDTGEKVLQGEAEIDQPRTAYVFTGQGSQAQNMGMDLYSRSPVAKAIWDRVDQYMMENFGFSILHIVKNNPPELTIPFGGRRGWKLRENYLALKIDRRLPDGTMVLEPVIKQLNESSTSHTFVQPGGLLFATQFAQMIITLHEKAAFEDMRSRGLVGENSMFAGHSLGEYAGLSSVADFLAIEKLCRITFYRGLCMQTAMERDEAGRTEYSMCAVDPGRVSKKLTEFNLKEIVSLISEHCKGLLQIVNYNVANQQYVCAGHLRALSCLGDVLNSIQAGKVTLGKYQSVAEDPSVIALIEICAKKEAQRQMPIELKRGVATIPLSGIDVPFHSTYLRGGVDMFRSFLLENFTADTVEADKLVGKYIPNLIAKPFEISREYVDECYKLTSSPRLGYLLKEWEQHEIKT